MVVKLLAASSLLAAAAYYFAREMEVAPEVTGAISDAVDSVAEAVGISTWTPAKIPARYRAAIGNAETAHGLPENMLARLLWQESRYKADARSQAGALGIAQFMPTTAREMGIDPLIPSQAIPAAAKYLAGLYGRFGNWQEALAAYNWGQGNVARKGLANAPAETRNYFAQILADLGMA